MNWVDIAILTTVLGSTLMGLYWGIIRQVMSFGGLIGGVFFAGRLYEPLAEVLHGSDGDGLMADPNWARIIAFAAVVIGFSLLLGVVASILRVVLNLILLGWVDHLLGGLVGLAMSLFLVMALLAVATVFPVPGLSDAVRESQVARLVSGMAPLVLAMLPPEFRVFQERMEWGGL